VISHPTAQRDEETGDSLAPMRNDIERDGVVFNDPQWAEVVSDCYGFSDCTVTAAEGSLPLFHTSSPLLGKKIVSAVYNSYASPLFGSESTSRRLIEHAIGVAQTRNVAYLQLKCLFPLPDEIVEACGLIRRDSYLVTLVPLSSRAARYSRYSPNFRRNLRRANRDVQNAGVRIERSRSAVDVARFYDVLARRYRDKHLMLPQPWRLFDLLRTRFLDSGRGDLWLARSSDGKIASGVLCLRHGAIVTACFGARDAAYDRLSVDAVLKDAMLEHYANEGSTTFDLGITSPLQG